MECFRPISSRQHHLYERTSLVDELEHEKTFEELELIFEKEEMFTDQLIGFLKEEGGTSSEDQLAFAIEVTDDLEKLSE